MEKFNYLIRKRNRAFKLFTAVAQRLLKLEGQMMRLIDDSNRAASDAYSQAKAHEAAADYLAKQHEATRKSRQDIEQFLPTEQN